MVSQTHDSEGNPTLTLPNSDPSIVFVVDSPSNSNKKDKKKKNSKRGNTEEIDKNKGDEKTKKKFW